VSSPAIDFRKGSLLFRAGELGDRGHPSGSTDNRVVCTGFTQFVTVLAWPVEIEVMVRVLDHRYS